MKHRTIQGARRGFVDNEILPVIAVVAVVMGLALPLVKKFDLGLPGFIILVVGLYVLAMWMLNGVEFFRWRRPKPPEDKEDE